MTRQRRQKMGLKEARTVQIQQITDANQIQQITDAKVKAKTIKAKPDKIAEMTDQEQIDDDTDSAVTEVKPIESETIPLEEDIIKNRIRILAML
jgi:seryl-tRNA synthetase